MMMEVSVVGPKGWRSPPFYFHTTFTRTPPLPPPLSPSSSPTPARAQRWARGMGVKMPGRQLPGKEENV